MIRKNPELGIIIGTRKIIYVICILITCLILSSCSSSDKSNDIVKKIAVVISTQDNPWFVVLGEAAKQHSEELGYEAVIFYSENNLSKETEHFDNIIKSGFKAILFNPTDEKGSITNVKSAKKADIPVFCMDRKVNANNLAISQIQSDNYSGCVLLGQHFVKTLGKKGSYVELLGLTGDNNTWNRSKGFHSVVDNYPDLKMLNQQTGDFDRDKAIGLMESMLQTYPNIDAVFCGNDAMAMGAYQAILAAERADKIMIFGFDGAAEVVDAIRQGKIEATGMQFPKTMAKTAAEYADKYIKGERNFNQKVLIPVELVTKENTNNYKDFGKAN